MLQKTRFMGLFYCVLALLLAVQLLPRTALAGPRAQERIPLQYGQAVTGSIDSSQFFQQYAFEGVAGDSVVITMEVLSGNLDSLLLLGDSELNLIAEDDDGGGGFNARIDIVLPASGVYVIEATRYGQNTSDGQSEGEFRLTLSADQSSEQGGPRHAGVFSQISFGDTVRGVLSTEDRFHLFWFYALVGDQIRIQSALSLGVKATLTLYDDAFNELHRDVAGAEIRADLSSEGVYFVGLSLDAQGDSGTYALALTGLNSLETGDRPALPLGYGEQVRGDITEEYPAERYTFSGQFNDQVLIQMNALDSSVDPFLYLYGPNGEIIGQDDDSGGGSNAELAVVLPQDGVYTLVATRFGQQNGSSTGAYHLTLSSGSVVQVTSGMEARVSGSTMPADFEGLPRLYYGDALSDTITADVYYRAYIVQASAGDDIIVSMENAGGDLDPMIVLLDSELNTVVEHDDISNQNRDARLEFEMPADGYYAILATRYDGETGTTTGAFRLSLVASNVAMQEQVGARLPVEMLVSGSMMSGQMANEVAHLYAFYASARDNIELDLTATGPLQSDTVLILADGDLHELAVSFDGTLSQGVNETGLYVVIVTRQGGALDNSRGFYDIELFGADPDAVTRLSVDDKPVYASGSILPYGTFLTGEITNAQPAAEYYFTGRAGDRITVRMESLDPTLDPALILLDPEGNELARDDDSAGDLNALLAAYVLTVDGEYTIVATRFDSVRGTSTGRYQLTLAGVPVTEPALAEGQTGNDPATALPLEVGQIVNGRVDDEIVAVFYVVQGRQGMKLQIDMVSIADDLDPFLAVLDANQALIASDDDNGAGQDARATIVLPEDGSYYIVATRFDLLEGTTAGDYLMSVVELQVP